MALIRREMRLFWLLWLYTEGQKMRCCRGVYGLVCRHPTGPHFPQSTGVRNAARDTWDGWDTWKRNVWNAHPWARRDGGSLITKLLRFAITTRTAHVFRYQLPISPIHKVCMTMRQQVTMKCHSLDRTSPTGCHNGRKFASRAQVLPDAQNILSWTRKR